MNYSMNSSLQDDLEALIKAANLNSIQRQLLLEKINDHYEEIYGLSSHDRDEFYIQVVSEWVSKIHQASSDAGWWDYGEDLNDYEPTIKSSKISLMHSELSEAVEGVRKDCNDKHLTNRKAEEVELADTVIRIFDYCGKYDLDIARAMVEKLIYNKNRADHKPEARSAKGGKKI